jgi:hypothetical protein
MLKPGNRLLIQGFDERNLKVSWLMHEKLIHISFEVNKAYARISRGSEIKKNYSLRQHVQASLIASSYQAFFLENKAAGS